MIGVCKHFESSNEWKSMRSHYLESPSSQKDISKNGSREKPRPLDKNY